MSLPRSSQVVRYDFICRGDEWDESVPSDTGDWVRWEDYERLDAEVAHARLALGGFGDPNGPFGGDLANGINAISMRCAAAEKALKQTEQERDEALRWKGMAEGC